MLSSTVLRARAAFWNERESGEKVLKKIISGREPHPRGKLHFVLALFCQICQGKRSSRVLMGMDTIALSFGIFSGKRMVDYELQHACTTLENK
jgi:hypothetical protein